MFLLFIAAVCGINIYDWWRLRCAFLCTQAAWSHVLLAAASHPLHNGTLLHVTSGIGVWGAPVRLLARPEVTFITLTARHQVSNP